MSEPKTCYVYVVSIDDLGRSKVGISENPHSRLRQLSTGSPFSMRFDHLFALPSKPIAYEVEQKFHKVMKDHRLNGEWFDVKAERATFLMCHNILAAMMCYIGEWEDEDFAVAIQAVGFPSWFDPSQDSMKAEAPQA